MIRVKSKRTQVFQEWKSCGGGSRRPQLQSGIRRAFESEVDRIWYTTLCLTNVSSPKPMRVKKRPASGTVSASKPSFIGRRPAGVWRQLLFPVNDNHNSR